MNYDAIRRELPKVELHAHLNGCIPMAILHELAEERGVRLPSRYFGNKDPAETNETCSSMYHRQPRSLQDCFDMFAILPLVVTDIEALRTITRSALQHFADHHTAYVELRSTPKRLLYHHCSPPPQSTAIDSNHRSNSDITAATPLQAHRATKLDYIQAVVEEMMAFEGQEEARFQKENSEWEQQEQQQDKGTCSSRPLLPMVCRLILSIDRGQSVEEASDTVELAIDIRNGTHDVNQSCRGGDGSSDAGPTLCLSRYVVGLDVGGNPTMQSFLDFAPLLTRARNANVGLGITIHAGEVPCSGIDNTTSYDEALAVLQFRPDRIGHAVLFPRDLLQQLSALQIPVETCPTSNIMTLELLHQNHGKRHCRPPEDTAVNTHSASSSGALEAEVSSSNGNDNVAVNNDLVHGLRQHAALQFWIEKGNQPLIVCTDDPGVFDTTPSQELWLLSEAFALSPQRLVEMVVQSMAHAFCDDETKERIQSAMRERANALLATCRASGTLAVRMLE